LFRYFEMRVPFDGVTGLGPVAGFALTGLAVDDEAGLVPAWPGFCGVGMCEGLLNSGDDSPLALN